MNANSPLLEKLTGDARASGDHGRTSTILLEPGASTGIGPHLRTHRPQQADLLVADAHTWGAAGEKVEASLRAAGRAPKRLIIEPHGGEETLTCDDEAIGAVLARMKREPGLNPIAIGSGTLNDTVKMTAHQLGIGYQVVATAASMNGYTSAIAAVLQQGVKRTLPAQQPEAVFADVDIIAAAPTVLTAAGFGDLLSKPFSHADWVLSHLLRGIEYDPMPAKLLDEAYPRLVAHAEAVGRAETEGIRLLAETVLISGFSMALAGTTAPASGGEHLISHYWDMEQHCAGEPLRALHGTQVGIATCISAGLYRRLMAVEPAQIDPPSAAARRPSEGWKAWLAELDRWHPGMTADVVSEIREQIDAKQKRGADLEGELEAIRARWDEIRGRIRPSLLTPEAIREALRAAKCPSRPSEIGVDAAHAERTIVACRHIRSRYVALDLMDDLGLLEGWARDVVRETERA